MPKRILIMILVGPSRHLEYGEVRGPFQRRRRSWEGTG